MKNLLNKKTRTGFIICMFFLTLGTTRNFTVHADKSLEDNTEVNKIIKEYDKFNEKRKKQKKIQEKAIKFEQPIIIELINNSANDLKNNKNTIDNLVDYKDDKGKYVELRPIYDKLGLDYLMLEQDRLIVAANYSKQGRPIDIKVAMENNFRLINASIEFNYYYNDKKDQLVQILYIQSKITPNEPELIEKLEFVYNNKGELVEVR